MASEFEGRKLGDRYEVLSELGRNTGRRTLLARDLTTGDRVATKVLLFGPDFQWDDLKLFEREAEILKNLDRPEIPRYLNAFELNEPDCQGFALVQTYIEAKSLRQHVRAGRSFTETDLQQIARKLLAILEYLHERRPAVVHRDITPSNVLLGDRTDRDIGSVYLVDFGSIRILAAREGGTVTVVGTYGYMPPEQFGGRAVPATDLYALGGTLIYLAAGKHPGDLPQKNLKIRFESETRLSSGFARWLRGMVEPSLDRRFSSAAEALQELDRARAGFEIAGLKERSPAIAGRPPDSNIELRRGKNWLEIVFPPRGFCRASLCHGAVAFACLYPAASFVTPSLLRAIVRIVGPASRDYTTISVVLAVCLSIGILASFWGVGLRSSWKAFFLGFVRIRVRMDPQQISTFWEFQSFRWPRRSEASHRVSHVVRAKERMGPARSWEFSLGRAILPGEVALQVGKKKYPIAREPDRASPELHWLAAEASRYLKLPIRDR